MKKNEVQDKLREIRVFNNHEICVRFGVKRVDDVFLDYRPPEPRVGGSKSTVYSPSHKTDPTAHWMDYGCKAFHGKRAESLPKAMAWASEKYKVKEWKPSPFGGKFPDTVFERLQKFLKEQK